MTHIKDTTEHFKQKPRPSFFVSKLIIINIAILSLGLIGIEALFGNWLKDNQLNRLNIIRNTTLTFKNNDPNAANQDRIIYRRDKYGFRGNYKSPDQIDILTIGGSTTDQIYIGEGKTWQDVLHNEFKKNGKTVYVVNAGVDGQSTIGHIKNFDWWFKHIPNLKAQYYLFYIGVNDFYISEQSPYDILIKEPPRTLVKKIKFIIKSKSALYYVFSTIRGAIQANTSGISHNTNMFKPQTYTDARNISNYDQFLAQRLIRYKTRLEHLCKQVLKQGGTPIFVTQSQRRTYIRHNDRILGIPKVGQINGKPFTGVDYFHLISRLNTITLQNAKKCGGIGIDLNSELEFNLANDFYDDTHNTHTGTQKIGIYLHSKLNHLF